MSFLSYDLNSPHSLAPGALRDPGAGDVRGVRGWIFLQLSRRVLRAVCLARLGLQSHASILDLLWSTDIHWYTTIMILEMEIEYDRISKWTAPMGDLMWSTSRYIANKNIEIHWTYGCIPTWGGRNIVQVTWLQGPPGRGLTHNAATRLVGYQTWSRSLPRDWTVVVGCLSDAQGTSLMAGTHDVA